LAARNPIDPATLINFSWKDKRQHPDFQQRRTWCSAKAFTVAVLPRRTRGDVPSKERLRRSAGAVLRGARTPPPLATSRYWASFGENWSRSASAGGRPCRRSRAALPAPGNARRSGGPSPSQGGTVLHGPHHPGEVIMAGYGLFVLVLAVGTATAGYFWMRNDW